jgi:hypothetical protein
MVVSYVGPAGGARGLEEEERRVGLWKDKFALTDAQVQRDGPSFLRSPPFLIGIHFHSLSFALCFGEANREGCLLS